MTDISESHTLFDRAQRVIPGGVNSPVRAFKSVGLSPRFIRSGAGCRIVDEDGVEFIDYVGSWGPLILGHAHPEVLEAIRETMARGTSFGAPTRLEVEMAELICALVPSIEMVRLVSSGTEAVMSAIRTARGFTGRDDIIKFAGCYHGHSDALLAKAGSGAATFSLPDSMGVPAATVQSTVSLPYNDLDAVRAYVESAPNPPAAILLEPIAGNMGVVPPAPGFLSGLRELCDRHGIVLIFDEVISGFRASLGGAQELYQVRPDMTCLGKIIGGGLPVGAFGGRKEIMVCLAPQGGVYQAGTLSGNPLAVSAGLTCLRILARDLPYPELDAKGARLASGVSAILNDRGISHTLHRVGSMMSLFFNPGPVRNYDDVLRSDKTMFNRLFAGMLEHGVYLAPSAFEAWFVGTAHTDADIDATLRAFGLSI